MARQVQRLPRVIPGERLHTEPKSSRPRWGLVLVLMSLIIALAWFFLSSSVFAIEQVELTGTDAAAARSIADRLIGRNIFRVGSATIEQDMKQAFPPVARVTVARGLPHLVRIEVELREPALRWQVMNQVYIVDTGGHIFEAGDKPEYASLPKIVDSSGVSLTIGQQVVTPAFTRFVLELPEPIEARLGKRISSIEVTETTFLIDVLLEDTVRLRLTTQRPSLEQVKAAQAILQAHPEAKYIDVRVTQRGYWK